jgi:hypothetical protein
MAADPVILCLEQVTDYAQFERLCCDLMIGDGYPELEPLGGFKDKGRDALHFSSASGENTIFAFSVREDWRDKLDEDAEKIHDHKHPCQKLIFLCNARYSSGDRDKAIKEVSQKYKWKVELFGVERLGTLLRSKHRQLIPQHPQIFTPAYFPPIIAGIDPAAQDFVFLDYADADAVLGTWLARKLMASGYRAWCRGLSLLAGDRPSEVMESVIRNNACRVVALYSESSLRDPDALVRRSMALGLARERGPNFFIPVSSTPIDRGRLDYQTKDLAFIPFERNWAEGIGQLLTSLEATSCPRPLPNGPAAAMQTLGNLGVVRASPETLLSNCFPVKTVPAAIHAFRAKKPITAADRRQLLDRWAFRDVDSKLLSFHRPPADVVDSLELTTAGGWSWRDVPHIERISSRNLAMELLRKSLVVKCVQRGLVRSGEKEPLAFPANLLPNDRLRFRTPDGSFSFVQSVGERTVKRAGTPVPYRYHLSPMFFVRSDLGGEFTALLKIRVHISDAQGKPLPKRATASRRKKLCKNWWNHEWLSRTLAVAHFMAEGEDEITIGATVDEQVVVGAWPLTWEVPVSIDEASIGPVTFDEDEILPGRYEEDDEEEGDDE